jgi:hypothetical protein
MPSSSFFMYPDNDENGVNDLDIFHWKDLPTIDCYSIFKKYTCLLWIMLKKTTLFLWWLFKIIYSLFGYYIMWITLHYLAIHLYARYCAPLTPLGFILSPLMVTSPHCVATRWVISSGSSIITTMWVTLGTYIIRRMMG